MSIAQDVKLTVSLSPHDKNRHWFSTTNRIMWGVVLALIPAIIASVVVFGPRSLLIIGVSVATCVLTEYAIEMFSRSRGTSGPVAKPRGGNLVTSQPSIFNGSAVITGILLAMNLPAMIPVWIVIVGGLFSIGVGKMVFGGLGQNPFNPALAGRAFLLASFPVEMTSFDKPFAWLQGTDAVSGATALGTIKEGLRAGLHMDAIASHLPNLTDLFLGGRGGCLGEVSILALLIGGLFMLSTRIITWETPVFFLGGITLVTGMMWLIAPDQYASPVFHLLTGGAVLGAFFMATDYVTGPMTFVGRIIFSLSAGVICGLIRLFGAYPEGTSYAILIMNALVPLIDRNLPPSRFGAKGMKPVKEAQL